MNKIKVAVCALGAAGAVVLWEQSTAQTPAQREMLEKMGRESDENAKAQQQLMEKLRKEADDRNAAMKGMQDPQRALIDSLKDRKPEPLTVRPLEPGSSKPREAAAPAPAPSRVTYGETRPLTGARELPKEDAPKAAAKPAAAKPAVAEKPPCVYKPVMTDAEVAACR